MNVRTLKPIFAVLLAAVATVAHADLTVVEKTSFDFSKMTLMGKPITPEQVGMIKNLPMFGGGGMAMTLAQSGNKVKVDTPVASTIIDNDAKTETILIPDKKVYMTGPIKASMADQYMKNATSNVKDMGETKTILGHEAHLYKFFIKTDSMTMTGFTWMTQDLPAMPSFGQANPSLDVIKSKLSGFPLKMTADLVMPSLFGELGLSYEVVSVATDPVPATAFDIPADYTKRDMPSFFGGPTAAPPAGTAPANGAG